MKNSATPPTNHIFTVTTKPRGLRATDQGVSGNCWMFGGLNLLRHRFMDDTECDNFEFSNTFLSFYDKIERANTIMSYLIDNNVVDISNRMTQYIIHSINDGGYWKTFAELVEKYGIAPKSAMEEADGSLDSTEMNSVLTDIIYRSSIAIIKNNLARKHNSITTNGRKRKTGTRVIDKTNNTTKTKTLKNVHNVLQTFLGRPPTSFEVFLEDHDGKGVRIGMFTPISFKDHIMESIGEDASLTDDFSVIFNNISLPMYKGVRFTGSEFMYGRGDVVMTNVEKQNMVECVVKSIDSNIPVWFAADLSVGFDPYDSALSTESMDSELVFGPKRKFSLMDEHKYGLIISEHAMLITGYNKDDTGEVSEFQVENSWSFEDHSTRGMDGFLTMTVEWFRKYVVQTVIHKSILDKYIENVDWDDDDNETFIESEPWNRTISSAKVKGMNRPRDYLTQLRKGRRPLRM